MNLKKICIKCLNEKDFSNFHKLKTGKYGLNPSCKSCRKEYSKKFKFDVKKVILRIFSSQKYHSKKRGHNPPTYSKEEFLEYCLNSNKFKILYKNWVESGFEKDLAPSIDRLDDKLGYSFSNIQVMTWKENREKYYNDCKTGKNNKNTKPVLQFDLYGNFIKEWYSIKSASRYFNVSSGAISNSCKGFSKTCYGFIWKYKCKL